MRRTPLESWICAKIGAPGPDLERVALEDYQLERLNATLQLAASKAPFYRRRLAGAPQRLRGLDELAGLPFTSADDLRQSGAEMLCVSQSEIERIVTLDTSGTTGAPKRLYFTRADQELTIDFFQHGMSTFTETGDSVMVLLPYARPGSVGDLLARGLQRLGARPALHGPVSDPQPALEMLQAQRAAGMVGAPTHVLALARFWMQRPNAWTPRSVLLSTDHAPAAIVAALEAAWGCAVYDHYGMTETGLGGGVDCQARRGYHLREADLYCEVIDPLSGKRVPAGQTGEVVFTTLTRAGMPLIRYRTGDISRFIPGACACGTALRTLEHVRGRYSGLLQLLEDGNAPLAMADLDEALFPIESVLNFSAALNGERRRARLALDFMLLPGAGAGWRRQALEALDGVEPIRAARHAGRLDVEIDGSDYDPARAGSLAKRKIVDRRSAAA